VHHCSPWEEEDKNRGERERGIIGGEEKQTAARNI
jgi:hypothetical protein